MRNWEGFSPHLLCSEYLLLSLDLMKDSLKDLKLVVLELSFKLSLPWGLLGNYFWKGRPHMCFIIHFLPYLFVISMIRFKK